MRKLLILTFSALLICFTIKVNADIIITELAPAGGGSFSEDWIEIQNTGDSPQDLTGWGLGDLDPDGIPETRRVDFPPVTLQSNQRAVIHFTNGVNDSTVNDNNPGFWDFYVNSTEDELPFTYETVVVYNDSDTIVDAVIYQLAESSFYDSDVNTIENANEWVRTPTEEELEENVFFDPFVKIANGYGIKRLGSDDTNTSADWAIVKKEDMTPGGNNLEIAIGDKFTISQNYPNPFIVDDNQITKIKVTVSEPVKLKIKIYDISGLLIRVIVEDKLFDPGQYIFSWNGNNDKKAKVESGTYMIIVTDGSETRVKKMTLLR